MSEPSFLQLNVFILQLCSMYPSRENANYFEKFLDWTYKIINLISLYFTTIAPFYEMYLGEKTGVASYALDIVNACCYVCSILTIHFFHVKGSDARKLITDMNSFFKWKSNNNLTEKSMSDISKITRKITIAFTTLTTCAVIMMGILPLLQADKKLPVPGTYPFNYKQSPYYQIIYLIQMHSQILMGALTGAGDSFLICMILTAAAQFDVLATDYHNSIYMAFLEFGVSKPKVLDYMENFDTLSVTIKEGDENNSNMVRKILNSKQFSRRSNKIFFDCIEHHQRLLEFCVKMEKFFWPFILMKISVSMFYNIFFAFAIVTNANDISLTLSLAQYLLCALTELYIYSSAGQTIITKSEQLRDSLYFSPWYVCDKKYQALVLMVIMRSSCAVRISIGKVFDMSHGSFIIILKTAMSYFAVLRQVVDK